VWGDGGHVRDWMYVDDACSAIALLLERGRPGLAYNVGPQAGARSNRQVATTVAEAAGRPSNLVTTSTYDRPQHDRRYAVDCSRIRELGWAPTVNFDEGIARTVVWYANHAEWWSTMVPDAEALYAD